MDAKDMLCPHIPERAFDTAAYTCRGVGRGCQGGELGLATPVSGHGRAPWVSSCICGKTRAPSQADGGLCLPTVYRVEL